MSSERAKPLRFENQLRSPSKARSHPQSDLPPEAVYELSLFKTELEMQNEELRRIQNDLEESRNRYRQLYDHSPAGHLTLNSSGRVLGLNETAARLLRVPKERLLGRLLSSFMSEREAEILELHQEEVLTARTNRSVELRLRRGDGTAMVARIDSQAESTPDTGPTTFRAVLVDITDLRAAEEQRTSEHLRAQALLKIATDGILTVDLSGRIESISEAAQSMFGCTESEVLGRSVQMLLPDISTDDSSAPLPAFDVRRSRMLGRRRDGTTFPIETGVAHYDMPDKLRLIVVVRDVTEIEQQERKLLESEARLRQIAEHTEDILCIFERETGRLCYANPSFETVTGRPAEALHESPLAWLRWVHPDDQPTIRTAYRNMLKGDPLDEEVRFFHADGSLRWGHLRAFPVETIEGEVVRDVAVVRDITASHALEDELRHAQKMEAVGTLATGVAHDFRNFLQGIAGCAHMALRVDGVPDEARTYLERIAAAVRRGASLTNQLTAYAHRKAHHPTPILLDAAIEAATNFLGHLVGDHIRIHLHTSAPGAVIHADPAVIEQILMNLASNAAHAMPRGGTLTIETSVIDHNGSGVSTGGAPRRPRHVQLIVRDTGEGMNARTQERVFEPFFTTKAPGEGTGLGLAMVREAVKDLGGGVTLSSEPGEGTEFRFILPCTEEDPLDVDISGAANTRFKGRVILVDDDPLVRITLRCYLEELGFRVMDAGGARAATSIFTTEEEAFDLIVTDVTMPDRTGPDLVHELRERAPHLRALYVSARDKSELVRKGLLGPSDRLLPKPTNLDSLASALDEVLGCPLLREENRGSEGPSLSRTRSSARRASRTETTIVLAEDNDAARLALEHLLAEMGYTVLAAADPTQALELAHRHEAPIDLLLTDVRLPRTSGAELAAELKRSCPHMSVIFMSGVPGLPSGATGLFVQKPIDLDVLTRYVEEALEDAPREAATH